MIREFKEDTKAAAQFLKEQGVAVSQTQLLEALSRAFGQRNWSTLRARLEGLVPVTNESQGKGATQSLASDLPNWEASKGPMSDEQYVRYGTNRCPVCGSRDISAEDVEASGKDAWDNNTCESCGSTWSTSFEATGYFDLVVTPSQQSSQEDAEALREDIVQELVDDVRERARKFEFSVQGGVQAQELAAESNEWLGLKATEAEIFEAALRLA